MKKQAFIFGFGYTAQFFAEKLLEKGYFVVGTSRNPHLRAAQNQKQANLQLIDFTKQVHEFIDKSDVILVSTPPDEFDEDPTSVHFADAIIKNKNNIRWLGYLSTTGVYGDYDGNWVNETMPTNSNSKRAQRRIKAEQSWMKLQQNHDIPVHIFRLAGIYGPHRNALNRVHGGKDVSVFKPNHYFSRIHVLDIVQFLLASIESPTPGEVFNVCDDTPAPLYEVEAFAANLLGLASPKLVDYKKAILSPMAKELYQNNRRISNQKIKQILKVEPIFKSYKEGLEYELSQINSQAKQI